MRVISFHLLIILIVLLILVEFISYLGFHLLTKRLSSKTKLSLSIFYILTSLLFAGLLLNSFSNPEIIRQSRNYSFFYFVIAVSILNLVLKSFFAIATLFSFFVRWMSGLRWQILVLSGSLLLSLTIFLVIFQGILFGRYVVNVQQHELYFDDLPVQLDGLKIVQFSDAHLGSFGKNLYVMQKTLQTVKSLHPDLLVFTGDIVNNFAEEMKGFESYLKLLPARYGKYAIQGNHDYGDYSNWPDSMSKVQNLQQIHKGLIQTGFKLLLNESDKLTINDTSLYIIGVENWGHPPFPQYARLGQAMNGVPGKSFKILLSHDPAHWSAMIVPKTDIQLTLSGHTHGGQFALKIAGIEFSPIYFYQKYWAGLYQSDNQRLYVNRGLGTIGFPGRVEMRPEITLLTLRRTKNH